MKRTGPDPFFDESPNAALILISLPDDPSPQAARQGVNFEMGCGSFDLVNQAPDVGFREGAESCDEWSVGAMSG